MQFWKIKAPTYLKGLIADFVPASLPLYPSVDVRGIRGAKGLTALLFTTFSVDACAETSGAMLSSSGAEDWSADEHVAGAATGERIASPT